MKEISTKKRVLKLNYIKALNNSLQKELITKKQYKTEMKFIRKFK